MRIRLLISVLGFMAISACTSEPATPPSPPPDRPVAETGEMCGGITGTICKQAKDFCRATIAAQCGAADQTGICTQIPQMCTAQYDPVCGCDGKTYGNECTANGAGVSAAYKGECRS